MSEQNLQSCLKLRNSQNPFCLILETVNRNYEKEIGMICSVICIYNSHSSKNASSWPPLGEKFHEKYENLQN